MFPRAENRSRPSLAGICLPLCRRWWKVWPRLISSCRRLKTLWGLVAPTPAGLESCSGSTQGDGRGVFRQKRLYSPHFVLIYSSRTTRSGSNAVSLSSQPCCCRWRALKYSVLKVFTPSENHGSRCLQKSRPSHQIAMAAPLRYAHRKCNTAVKI